MNKKTGYVLSRVCFEYNDEGYDWGGLSPQSVYANKKDAEEALRQSVRMLAMSDSSIGQYCAAIDCDDPNELHARFPDVFDCYGCLKMKGRKWSDGYVDITEEAAEFIVDNFRLFDITEVTVYE